MDIGVPTLWLPYSKLIIRPVYRKLFDLLITARLAVRLLRPPLVFAAN
jgi:hypothetical protein